MDVSVPAPSYIQKTESIQSKTKNPVWYSQVATRKTKWHCYHLEAYICKNISTQGQNPPLLTPHIFITWLLHHCSRSANQPITTVPISGMQFCSAYELLAFQLCQMKIIMMMTRNTWVIKKEKKNLQRKRLWIKGINGSLSSENVISESAGKSEKKQT